MTTFTVTAAFNVACYRDLEIEAETPEEAIIKLKAMVADESIWNNWSVDYGSADQHRIVSFTGPENDTPIIEDTLINSGQWGTL